MSAASLTLYFDLKPGKKADLEVIAAASIQWVEALRAAARELDPESDIHVELIDAKESSLRLNTILEWAEGALERIEVGSGKYPRLRQLALALVVFVPTVGYPTYDFYFGSRIRAELSEEDRARIDELLKRLGENPEVIEKKKKFFRAVEKDPSITAVGIAEGRDDPPAVIVPNTEFAERSGLWAILEEEEEERTTYPIVDAILISPVLLPLPRAWAFRPEGLEEFTATMRDPGFLRALEQDHVKESLRVGIKMKLRLKIEERKVGGVWLLKRGGRSVVEVIEPKVG